MHKTELFRVVIIVACVYCLLFVGTYTAEARIGYTVSPLVINEEVVARDIIKRDITLTNTGTVPVTVYPSVNNISLDEGGTVEDFVSRSLSDATASLSAWIEVRRSGIDLMRGESVTVPVTFRVHPTPTPGEYNAFIGFGYGRIAADAEQMVKDGRAPGTVVTFTVADDRTESLRLSRFVVDKFITSPDNQAVRYTVTNPGDTDLVPGGEIIFYDSKGVEVGAMEVNPDRKLLSPGAEEQFVAAMPARGLFGKYKGHLTVEYGNSQLASIQDIAFFYVLPTKQLAIIGGVLLVCIMFVSYYIHRRYFDDEDEELLDADYLEVRVRPTQSETQDHDVDLKNLNETGEQQTENYDSSETEK